MSPIESRRGREDAAATTTSAAHNAPGKSDSAEVIVPGPTDQDTAEAAEAKNLFQAVTDRAPLRRSKCRPTGAA